MNETNEKPKGFTTSIYVTDKASFEECKRLLKLQGRSLSEEIMDFVLKRLAELKGTGSTESSIDSTRRFEELKAQHFQLGQKADKFKAALEEKKVYDNYLKKFGEILGYDPGGSSWELGECIDVIVEFLKHGNDYDWKRAETRFIVSYKVEGIKHTFLDYLECGRERKKIDRKLIEMRTSPEELARLDEREHLEEEQRKKDAETRKLREAEEARKQKEENEAEDPYSQEEEEEDEGESFTVEPHLVPPGKLVLEVDQPEESEEGPEEEGGEND